MLSSLRILLAAAYVGVWVFVVYGGRSPPAAATSVAKIVFIALVVVGHLVLGASLRSWWACTLAVVPAVVAAPAVDQWPLLVYYVPPIGVMIAIGVLAARARR